jgi:hypothetical protein
VKTDRIHIGLVNVVLEAHKSAFSVQSDFARKESEFVAMAASLGLISTRVHRDIFSRHWRPTVNGLWFLETQKISEYEPEENLDDFEQFDIIDDS